MYSLHHTDAFTTKMFGGNPTATVTNADTLSETEMKQIAIEMNCPESGFVLPSNSADLRIRYFTRGGDEINFCGHATVGALCALVKDKKYGINKAGVYSYTIETKSGILPVTIDVTDFEDPIYRIEAPKIELVPAPYSLKEVTEVMKIPQHLVDWDRPLMLEKTSGYLYFAVPSLEKLGQLDIDFASTAIFQKRGSHVIICALTAETFDKKNQAHARGFAPMVSIPEDPFTGSMQGGLAAYLLQQKMVSDKQEWLHTEQGHFINRPGEVALQITLQTDLKVKLFAKAVHVFSTTLNLG